KLTQDLLTEMKALNDSDVIAPRIATDDEIALIHDPAYIDAVKKAGKGSFASSITANYRIGTKDTTIFSNMHEASALIVGGTLTAVDAVMTGKSDHALNVGGGLHHGFRGKASGFCIYNDSSIAIEYMKKKYGAKVLYVDTDAHH
ncbi:acetoin utilization protein AcuC, partial [Micrococcus sp. SIMBA_131]